jgi:synaptic vesicle membrane protein VAT-1
MRQVWIPRKGGPEVLEVREAPDPEPKAGEVRIRVSASGVNFADCLARIGMYPDAPKLPAVMGYEVAGEVDRVGPGVQGLAVGTRVMAIPRFGGYTDRLVVPARQALPLPDGLSYEKAAAIPVNYLTAWIMLVEMGNVRAGETVLVHAAAGGVGQAALQICRWRGATVIGTASTSKHERLKAASVAHCIDYGRQDFEAEVKRITGGKGVDIVLDAVGGQSFRKSYRSLAPLGRLFMFGVSSMSPSEKLNLGAVIKGLLSMPSFRPIPMMNENRGVFGINLGHLMDQVDKLSAALQEVLALTAKGTLDPVVDKAFPFAQAGEAHRYIQERKNFGKVLLVP